MVELTDITKPWKLDQVILAPGSASLLIQHYRRREQDLLEANNRYLERARDAEARVSAAIQAIWPCRNEGGFDREIGPIGCSMGDNCVCAGVYPILVGACEPTPPPSSHVLCEPHPDDLAVDRFAAAMKAKLARKRDEGKSGWDDKDECSQLFLSQLLREHVEKGDALDVGNFAMMLHQREERISSLLETLQGE